MELGRTLAIVNPAAQNGNGAKAAAFLRYAAGAIHAPFSSLSIETTREAGHATALASAAASFDSVLVVGGDGVIHETLNGLMALPRAQRPTLGVLPCGNGNDYARTLRAPFDIARAFEGLAQARAQSVDVGVCNGRFFAETVSFGLDAAIALGTHERRARTGREGTRLFVEEGLNQLLNHRDEYAYRLALNGAQPVSGSMLMFAVQNGPTYGGGFKVCPAANVCDGALDLCIAHPPIGLAKAMWLFTLAKDGRHVGHTDAMSFAQASTLHIEFEDAPPAQIDGERIEATTFDIAVEPAALDVLFFPTEGGVS